MGTRCRLCATSYSDLVSVLEDLELLARIDHLFQVSIFPEDRLPTGVCYSCKEIVNNTWEFNAQVQKAQELLSEILIDDPLIIENDPLLLPVGEKKEIVTRQKSRLKPRKCKQPDKVVSDDENDDDPDDISSELSDSERHDDGSITPKEPAASWAEYPWQCCECSGGVSSVDELREHYASVHGQPPRFPCADCPKVYAKYSIFVAHARVHRPRLKFCCDVCSKWFATIKSQDRHRSQHGDERPHGCQTCGKRFRMQSALLVHARSHLPADLKNCHQCDQCPKKFGTKPNLMAHKRIHAGVRDYTCDQCGKSFVQKGNLDNHLLTHTAARPFSCAICGKSFKTHIRLRKHSSVHSGLKPHKCDVCGREFRERGTLKEHLRIHTGAMPFTCEFCGKSFRFKGVLTTHRRQHTGERPYSCLECQHHFTNWPNYNKHMKRRHGINTSVTVRKPQSIPPTGMPQRNPPGSVLAPPQLPEPFTEQPSFYPVLGLYNLPDELLAQRVEIEDRKCVAYS
ncbi:zinc finger protein [Holotrichia oblita]|uniref:Zinc finger protein n=1 Tax=Holotrichia oblita TaxID=644536 RepID=A0ACB9TBY2_HOLOL|nr:zinc finger protein [Holotrichia oblita]